MAHWFDKLSDRAVRDDDAAMTRRDIVKAAGVGVAGGVLVAPAGQGVAGFLRAGSCACQRAADRRYSRALDNYIDQPTGLNLLYNPLQYAVDIVAFTGLTAGFIARKIDCGSCERDASGDNKPAPPSHAPCRAARGGVCLETGGEGSGCPAGTTFCSGGLCCFGNDLCCACNGQPTCCVSAVGCACC